VAKFNLRFERENINKFNHRVEAARRACALYESQMRFMSRVDQIPTDQLPVLSDYDFNMIHRKMALPGDHSALLRTLDDEVRAEFARVNNRMQFEWDLEHNPLIPDREEFMLLRSPRAGASDYGLVMEPQWVFRKRLRRFADIYLLSDELIQKGLQTIWTIFQQASSVVFLSDGYPELLSLEEFTGRQSEQLETTTKRFKDSIQETLESVVAPSLMSASTSMNDAKSKKKHSAMVALTTRMVHTVLLEILNDATHSFRLLSLLTRMETIVAELPLTKSPFFEMTSVVVSFDDCEAMVRDNKKILENVLNQLFLRSPTFLSDRRFLEQVLARDPNSSTSDFHPNANKTLEEYRRQLNDFNRVVNIIDSGFQGS
jgi:hypothetical protein